MHADQRGTAREVLADVHERLVREFSEWLKSEDVAACVTEAHRELDAVPAGALPELLERLARVRLRGQLGRVGRPQVGQSLDLAATS